MINDILKHTGGENTAKAWQMEEENCKPKDRRRTKRERNFVSRILFETRRMESK